MPNEFNTTISDAYANHNKACILIFLLTERVPFRDNQSYIIAVLRWVCASAKSPGVI